MLKLYNTLTKKIEPFKVMDPSNVKMYTCGPSTYQPPHIGNHRTFLFEDVLQRYLEYIGYRVIRTLTLTDVEDKALDRAKKENLTVEELTKKNEAILFKDFQFLKIKKPDYPIKASRSIDQAEKLISKLLEKSYAHFYNYKGQRNIYFDPLKFKDFGKIAHLDMKKWPKKKRRFHKDTYPGTPWNMGDFVIWHGCQNKDPCFETSFGKGRPAWNIQDPAIVTKTLGFSIDLACGGIDNLVRHHDYTLAIVEAVSNIPFCEFWLHGNHLLVDGQKMSKSKGNILYPSDIEEMGFNGSQIRFFLIYGHYRQKSNFSLKKLRETSKVLDNLREIVKDLAEMKVFAINTDNQDFARTLISDFEEHMNNDLNVEKAFDSLEKTVKKIHERRFTLDQKEIEGIVDAIRRIDTVFQCIF